MSKLVQYNGVAMNFCSPITLEMVTVGHRFYLQPNLYPFLAAVFPCSMAIVQANYPDGGTHLNVLHPMKTGRYQDAVAEYAIRALKNNEVNIECSPEPLTTLGLLQLAMETCRLKAIELNQESLMSDPRVTRAVVRVLERDDPKRCEAIYPEFDYLALVVGGTYFGIERDGYVHT